MKKYLVLLLFLATLFFSCKKDIVDERFNRKQIPSSTSNTTITYEDTNRINKQNLPTVVTEEKPSIIKEDPGVIKENSAVIKETEEDDVTFLVRVLELNEDEKKHLISHPEIASAVRAFLEAENQRDKE